MTQPYGQQPQPGQPGYGQPGYGPPEYGQPQAGQPPYGQPGQPPPYSQAPGTVTQSTGRFDIVAGVLTVIALVLGVLAVTVFGWYRDNFQSVSGGSDTSSGSKFTKIHDALDQLQKTIDANPSIGKFVHLGISPTYFSWLGYVLLAAAVILALIAAAPVGPASAAVRGLAAVVALAGIGLTLWAIDLISFDSQLAGRVGSDTPTGYLDWIKHTSFGAWAMVAAFLLCFIAALMPPKRSQTVINRQY